MEKQLRELLGLDEKADVLETVKSLKSKSETQTVSLAEHQTLTEKVKTLETRLTESQQTIALKDRDERVRKAMEAGKVVPAQKEWADAYALSDPSGFDKFVATSPKVVEFGERGGESTPATELTETEKKVAKILGVADVDMVNAKKQGGNS